jgi:pyruvate/2-oxoglutarate dehydrogenase complex dihydrolipoamide acyltransferase (E2) component
MPTNVIMPALELARETGKVLRWLKAPGDRVAKGDPIVEIETDKVTAEIEAAAAGFLGEISAREGDVVTARDIPSVIRAKLPLAEKRREQGCQEETYALY